MPIYLTEQEKPDGKYGSYVIASSFEQAQKICDKRGFNEKVVGIVDDSDSINYNSDHLL
jgi:hypothetical protein